MHRTALLSILAVLVFSTAALSAPVKFATAHYAGHIYVDLAAPAAQRGTPDHVDILPPPPPDLDVIYNNEDGTVFYAATAVTSPSLASVWGDHVTTVGTGVLKAHTFSIANTNDPVNPQAVLLTATVEVKFFDFATNALLGSYTTPVDFSGPPLLGLQPQTFGTVTVTGLEGLGINLNVTNLLVTQRIISKTGAATDLGVACNTLTFVGSSDSSMYIDSPTFGAAGYYTVPGSANPLYEMKVDLNPLATQPTTWGKVKALYR